MRMKQIIELFDTGLKYCVIAILLLSSLVFIFIFTINWEDWFFGIKLDGMVAGLYLLIKGLGAASLAFLLLKYPRYSLAITGIVIIYFGYLLVDSAVTIRRLTNGFYSPLLLLFFVFPIAFLIIRTMKTRISKNGKKYQSEKNESGLQD
ncbi:MAG: hypothetical protein LUQ45_01125 [Methanoregulaceae archaeon]|nr:hypothetical protein [Methanoregulaceae archaeon]